MDKGEGRFSVSQSIKTHETNSPIKRMTTYTLKKGLKNKTATSFNVNKNAVTYGERLYYKSLALSTIKQSKVRKEQKEQKDKFTKTYSFIPKINDSSRQTKPLYLKPKEKKTLLTTQQLKEKKDLEEIKKFSKKKIPQDKIDQLSEMLYNENTKIKRNKDELSKMVMETYCPFTPKTNSKEDANLDDFYIRLQRWINQMNLKNEKIKNAPLTDDKTGQLLFSPLTYSTTSRPNTFEFLYNEYFALKNKKEKLEKDAMQEILDKANQKKLSDSSEKIIVSKRRASIDRIYSFLVGEELFKYTEETEEKIKQTFSEELYKYFSILLSELKELNETLDSEEFYFAMMQLLGRMGAKEKSELFSFAENINN